MRGWQLCRVGSVHPVSTGLPGDHNPLLHGAPWWQKGQNRAAPCSPVPHLTGANSCSTFPRVPEEALGTVSQVSAAHGKVLGAFQEKRVPRCLSREGKTPGTPSDKPELLLGVVTTSYLNSWDFSMHGTLSAVSIHPEITG